MPSVSWAGEVSAVLRRERLRRGGAHPDVAVREGDAIAGERRLFGVGEVVCKTKRAINLRRLAPECIQAFQFE